MQTHASAFGLFDLLLITPERRPLDVEESVRQALDVEHPERVALLLRAKHLEEGPRRALGEALRRLTAEVSCALLISGDVALCEELDARGVQLPEQGMSVAEARARLGESTWIGASRHDLKGLRLAHAQRASFATLSPVHATPEKGAPLGIATFCELAQQTELPVVALGGLTCDDVPALLQGGAAAIAVIRAIFDHDQPARAVTTFLTSIDRVRALAGAP